MMKNIFKWSVVIVSFLIIGQSIACKQDDPDPKPEPAVIADFSYAFNTPDLRIVTFTSKAENYKALAWDFGDTSAISNEINPVHIYNLAGTYTVRQTATSPAGATDVHSDEVTITIPPPNELGKAKVWLTKGDKSKLLSSEPDLLITETGSGYPLVNVDTAAQHQSMDGFGAALTGSSAYLIDEILDAGERAELLTSLFDPVEGIGISYLRLTIGASDFSLSDFSYDDMPAGQTDFDLQHFSLDKDREDVIPVLKEIIQIAPEINLMGSPWSPPAWMKTSGSMIGGQLKTNCYSVYADYFVKYIQEMALEGINIASITPQNEPLYYTASYPCMQMQPIEQLTFIKSHLGPKFLTQGINTKIIIYDHNWDDTNYAISILNDPGANGFIAGSAFHAYAGDVSAMTTVHNAHPDKELHFTEISGGAWATNFGDNLMWFMRNIFIGTAANWSRTAMMWNLALDQNYGPQNNGCGDCRGVVTIGNPGGQIGKNEEFYSIGHFSKFVRPGAKRISSTQPQGLSNVDLVAFQNPDGSKALVVCNYGNDSKTFGVKQGIKWFSYTIDAKSVATIVW
jgi:glucosylceramidase